MKLKILPWTTLCFFSGLLAVCFLYQSEIKKVDKEEENENALQDNMQAAIHQEFEATKDPALGYVPRERLWQAIQYAEELRNQRAAISGITWTERGPNNVGGRTRTMMIDPNDATHKKFFAAGIGGGLWKTNDITVASPVWSTVNDLFANLAISSICYDPQTNDTMYFGTGEGWFNADAIRGDGIFRSMDGGVTWTQLASTAGNSNFQLVQKVVVHPTTHDVYAATSAGLFRSQDFGTTWSKVLGNGSGSTVNAMADIEIASNNKLYVSAGIFSNDGIYSSSTGNLSSWTKLNTGTNGFPTTGFYRIEIACAPSDSNVIYCPTQSSSTNGIFNIYKSTDGGATWSTVTKPTDADGGIGTDYTRTQAWYDLIAAVDPNNSNTLLIGGVDLFKSTNAGSTWTQISHWYGGFGFQYVHADQHMIYFEPGNSNNIYFGNDGGIWSSINGGTTINSKNTGYNVTQYYCGAMDPTAYTSTFTAGAQDNGTHKLSSAGLGSGVQITGGDGAFCHIDQNQSQYYFDSYVNNNYYSSSNSGGSFTSVTLNNNTGAAFINPTDYDNTANIMYCADNNGRYVRWTNPQTGSTNARITITSFNSGTPTAITVSPTTSNRVFFGINNGRVVQVDNANTIASGSAGTQLNSGAGMPSGTISCVEVQNGNDNHIIATYSNYGVNSVWETLNGGTNWTSIEGNLPDMPIRWAIMNPNDSSQVLLATEVGVWSTDHVNGGSTVWGPSNGGLANVSTRMLQIRSSDKLVLAITHGRGLFTTDFFAPAKAIFTASNTLNYIGMPVAFTDGSYHASSWLWDFGDGQTSTLRNPTHTYSSSGVYTVSLSINNGADVQTQTNLVQILPNLGTPFLVTNGGDFESNTNYFGSYTVNGVAFQLGNSSISGKNGTHSGSNAWVTGLTNSTYTSNNETYLYTPNYNCSTSGNYTLSFYAKYSCENQWDGFNIEYSLDKGTSWSVLGSAGAGWYNFANTTQTTGFPQNTPYFTNAAASFTQYSLITNVFSGNNNVAFRIVFKSDGSINQAGLAFDDFELNGPNNSPLPVELISFNGKNLGSENQLTWITDSEINCKFYLVERSTDGLHYTSIGTVNGNGNSILQHQYSFTDSKLTSSLYYYRICQIDFNGLKNYSNAIAITTAIQNSISVWPNPFSNQIAITNTDVGSDVQIYSAQGTLVYQTVSTDAETSISDLKFENGIYFLIITSKSGKRNVMKLVKQ